LSNAEMYSHAFIRKMRPEVWLGQAVKVFKWWNKHEKQGKNSYRKNFQKP